MERAFREHCGVQGPGTEAAAVVADALHQWLEETADLSCPWATPAWFAEGFLRGLDIFGADAAPRPAAAPPELGLRQIAMTIPEDMKTKQWAQGLELSNRDARIIVCEQNDEMHEMRRAGLLCPPLPGWPRPSHLRDELDRDFTVGELLGLRLTSYQVETGLPIIVTYMLTMPAVALEIGVFSRKKRGSDLHKYEALLGTIRRR